MFRVERHGDVAVISFDNPPVNSMRFDQWRALPDLISGLQDDSVGVMIFTGLPHRHFCAGNDFREFDSLSPDQTLAGTSAVRDALRAVRESPIIAMAGLHGAALGSGFMLACACDIRLATRDAKLGLPEVKVGAIGGYRIAREVIGQGEARTMVLTGEPISGERAYQIGLVHALDDTAEATLARATQMAANISTLIRGRLREEIKACFNTQDATPLWEAYDLERNLAARVMGQALVDAS